MPNRQGGEWEKAANEERARQAADQVAARRAAAANQAEQKRIAKVHVDGMALINDVIQQFRKAMRRAGNPGRRSFWGVLVRDLELRFRYNNPNGGGDPISSYWEETSGGYAYSYVRVCADGRWRYGTGTEMVIGAGLERQEIILA